MRQTPYKIILPLNKMSEPALSLVEIATQRLLVAPQIENEWNAMSYKDRAAWWVSAKWYGYMSTEAYRRGDPFNPDVSCVFGEPGFFMATRIPYFDAQAAVSIIVAGADAALSAPTAQVATVAPVAPVAESTTSETAADETSTLIRESITNSALETTAAATAPATPATAPATPATAATAPATPATPATAAAPATAATAATATAEAPATAATATAATATAATTAAASAPATPATATATATPATAATAATATAATATTISNSNSHKKKKKNHIKPANPGEGKTIEIRVGASK
jgi:hypothetical protein